MDNDITLEQIVAVDDVLKRWHKKAAFLNELAAMHSISLYVLNESRVRPTDGKTIYFCSQVSSIYCYDYSSEGYDTDNIFLRPEDMAAYEKAHPEILWEPAHPEKAIMREYGENIPADVVRQWLKMSPMQFVDFMNSGVGPVTSLEEDFRRFRDNCGYKYADYTPFFTTEILKENCVIHILDWEDWRQEHPNMVHETPVRESALAAKGEELEQARAELAALREENAALKAELEKARTALEKARQGQTGQAKGTKVNTQKWKDSVQAACGLLVFILQGTKDDWRSGEFSAELCKRYKDYHTDVERIAWSALPDKFKHGPGRPAEKPGNSEYIETIDDLPF